MKTIILVLISFCMVSFSSNAQFFRERTDAFTKLVEASDKHLGKDFIKETFSIEKTGTEIQKDFLTDLDPKIDELFKTILKEWGDYEEKDDKKFWTKLVHKHYKVRFKCIKRKDHKGYSRSKRETKAIIKNLMHLYRSYRLKSDEFKSEHETYLINCKRDIKKIFLQKLEKEANKLGFEISLIDVSELEEKKTDEKDG